MIDFIEKLRGKPGHVRQRIAVGTASGVTALIALAWVAVLASSHPFSSAQFYANAPGSNTAVVATQAKTGFQDLLGAVGAAGGSDAPGITVVTESSTTVNQATPTVIPF